MAKKSGLGRGLNHFIKDVEKPEELIQKKSSGSLMTLSLEKLYPNPHQPRRSFPQGELEELAESIKKYGIIQPLVVRPGEEDDRYEIIAGERRFRGAKLAGLREVPCILRDVEEGEKDRLALIENIQREDLNPVEEAMAYRNIMEAYGLTQEAAAKTLGKSRSYIANTVRLLKLEPEILEMLASGKLSVSHGKLLLSIKNPKERLKKAKAIVKEGMSVEKTGQKISRKPGKKDIYLLNIQEDLSSALGTKVDIKPWGKKKTIEISYYGDEDLERILDVILGEVQ